MTEMNEKTNRKSKTRESETEGLTVSGGLRRREFAFVFFYRSASLHFSSKSSAILSIFCFSSVLMDITLASCCCLWVSISSYKDKQVHVL